MYKFWFFELKNNSTKSIVSKLKIFATIKKFSETKMHYFFQLKCPSYFIRKKYSKPQKNTWAEQRQQKCLKTFQSFMIKQISKQVFTEVRLSNIFITFYGGPQIYLSRDLWTNAKNCRHILWSGLTRKKYKTGSVQVWAIYAIVP